MPGYNKLYWQKRIPEYLHDAWSQQATPFAKQVIQYFRPGGKLLELGAGAGQDGLWFAEQGLKVTISDASDVAFDTIKARASRHQLEVALRTIDLTQALPFDDNTFDAVYAQLVLHYFNDSITDSIMLEISRVLKPGGILACMVNSVHDREYDAQQADKQGFLVAKGLRKRYFTLAGFARFVTRFETILLDEKGHTPKDDAVKNFGMIRFVGKNQKAE